MKTQHTRIINYLKRSRRGLTSIEAIEKLGTLNLPGRISELRSRGYKIQKTAINTQNRYGEPVRVIRYWMA